MNTGFAFLALLVLGLITLPGVLQITPAATYANDAQLREVLQEQAAQQVKRHDANAQPIGQSKFLALPIVIDPKGKALAAYQFELTATPGSGVRVVGIENGEHPAFAEAPYYDAKALAAGEADRLIVADFSLLKADDLPQEKIRVATVMLRVPADRDVNESIEVVLTTAAGPNGRPVPATLTSGDQP